MTLLLSNGSITIDFNQDYLERFYKNRYNTAYNEVDIRKNNTTYSIDINRNTNDFVLYNFLYQRMKELGYQNNINDFIYFKIIGNLTLKLHSKNEIIILTETSEIFDITDISFKSIKQIDFIFESNEKFSTLQNNNLFVLLIIVLIFLFLIKS